MIGPFSGEYRFLSNFWLEPQRMMLSNEHFFQAAKAADPAERANIMFSATPGIAKRAGRLVAIREDWDSIKESVMLEGLRNKFYLDRDLRDKLIATGGAKLVELNTWGDRYWGVDMATGEGANRLGELLMDVRAEVIYRRKLG